MNNKINNNTETTKYMVENNTINRDISMNEYMCPDKYKFMISWRNRKISFLEEQVKNYEETVNACCALIATIAGEKNGQVKRISKKRIAAAFEKKYDVTWDDKYYYVKVKEE